LSALFFNERLVASPVTKNLVPKLRRHRGSS
jgi:hypothetical protein